LALLLCGWCFGHAAWPAAALLFALAAWRIAKEAERGPEEALFHGTMRIWVVAGLAMNLLVYPRLLRYQGNAQVGKWIAAQGIAREDFYNIAMGGPAMDFYAGYNPHWLATVDEALPFVAPGRAFYMDEARYAEWRQKAPPPREVVEVKDFTVQLLTIEFLNPLKRDGELLRRYRVRY
ncbi:MAG: hypothetical protein ACK4L7_10160, partial [Flavobacteriales bacterium]